MDNSEDVAPSDEAANPARITITRKSPEDVGFREVYVSVDGRQIAVLQAGDSITCELSAGHHRLRAHNTLFYKTHQIDLQPGEHRRFRAVNRAGWGTYSLLAFLSAGLLYLTFEPET